MTADLRPSLAGDKPTVLREIDDFDTSIARFREGRVPDAVFLEHRLRFGVYGQRQDGVHMMRSKLPLGLLSPATARAMADLTEAYSAGVAHLTTRQDIQVHFIALEQTPAVMRVLADAEATTREACGNVVRNVCASEVSGVLHGEAFDVTPHGMALARFLLRHPDGQSLGRKFKATLASSPDPRFDLSAIHDLGASAVVRIVDGVPRRGFRLKVGGGLGAVPHEAKVLYDFLPEEELLPTAHAILRVFAEHGEKKNRARARMKFVVAAQGIDRFRALVEAQRAALTPTPAWTAFLDDLHAWDDRPLHGPGGEPPRPGDAEEAAWLRTSVLTQRQHGYAVVKVRVPRGDLSPSQLRGLATLLETHTGDTLRIGADQSLYLRWVPTDRLLAVRAALAALGLGLARPGGIADPVTCPGADTCKLGVTAPRSVARLAGPTLDRLAADPALEGITIKISGCPNSCAQHQIADIGFFGAARTVEGVTAPHYMLVLGGWAGGVGPGEKPGDGLGQVFTKVPAFRVGDVIERLCGLYRDEATPDEVFGAFVTRVGRARIKALLADLQELPSPTIAPWAYREHGKDEAFAVVRGMGECAGEIVELADLLLTEADAHADAAVDQLDAGASAEVLLERALSAMTIAARALLTVDGLTNPTEFDAAAEFRRRFYDAGRIYEGVGHYYLGALTLTPDALDADRLRRLVAEAGLFVEEAHTILGKLRSGREVA